MTATNMCLNFGGKWDSSPQHKIGCFDFRALVGRSAVSAVGHLNHYYLVCLHLSF